MERTHTLTEASEELRKELEMRIAAWHPQPEKEKGEPAEPTKEAKKEREIEQQEQPQQAQPPGRLQADASRLGIAPGPATAAGATHLVPPQEQEQQQPEQAAQQQQQPSVSSELTSRMEQLKLTPSPPEPDEAAQYKELLRSKLYHSAQEVRGIA